MKKIVSPAWVLMMVLTCAGTLRANELVKRDSTGVPGDHFSLQGALELFKTAKSPEEFEKLLNSEDSKVNNLDLNGDGEIDYIKVIDKSENEAHAFILQAAVSENESQDIAVIELEKTGTENAAVQIVGDEDIFGEETIVEPAPDNVSNVQASVKTNVTVNVWAWPAVRYVYGPTYTVWVSPWGWRTRPVWWRPWRPVRYTVFHPYATPYRSRYVVVPAHRIVHAHRIYRPVRTTSVVVTTRHRTSITTYRSRETTVHRRGGRVTRTTAVNGPRGNTRVTRRTRVRGGN